MPMSFAARPFVSQTGSVSAAAFGLLLIAATSVQGQSTEWTDVGKLSCTVGPSIGLVAGARQHARCTFRADKTSKLAVYIGRLDKVSRKSGLPSGSRLAWTVLGKPGVLPGDLPGLYQQAADSRDDHNSQRMCKASPESVCLHPATIESRWKKNQASAIVAMRIETNITGRKTSDKKR